MLDGAGFVQAAAALPPEQLVAAIANTLLDGTVHSRPPAQRGTAAESGAGLRSLGEQLAAVPSLFAAADRVQGPRGLAAVQRFAELPQPLFAGAPSLAALLAGAVSREPAFGAATVELFSLPFRASPSNYAQKCAPLRAAARRGRTLLCCLSDPHAWCTFAFGSGGQLEQSACCCGAPDFGGVLWCKHRRDAASALAGGSADSSSGGGGSGGGGRSDSSIGGAPAPAVLDLDRLEAALRPLPSTQLAQLLLQLALLAQCIPDMVEGLGLPAARGFWLPELQGLPLSGPGGGASGLQAYYTSELRKQLKDLQRTMEVYVPGGQSASCAFCSAAHSHPSLLLCAALFASSGGGRWGALLHARASSACNLGSEQPAQAQQALLRMLARLQAQRYWESRRGMRSGRRARWM